jgi:hypothetical protein
MNARHRVKLVKVEQYVAEVDVELIDDPDGWGPYLSVEDAKKLDDVRSALQHGDTVAAGKMARVYRLTPVNAA